MKLRRPESCQKDPNDIPNWKALNYCFSKVKSGNHCIDAGGHVGSVARILCNKFNHVHSFEPLFGKYLKQNTADKKNITIYEVGLGFEKQSEKIYIMPTNTGGSSIVEHKRRDKFQKQSWTETKIIPIRKLDDYNFKEKIDFIKIDVESYEWHVIRGAEQTLKTHRPLMMVELMKRYEDKEYTVGRTHTLLMGLGYRLIKQFDEDWVYECAG